MQLFRNTPKQKKSKNSDTLWSFENMSISDSDKESISSNCSKEDEICKICKIGTAKLYNFK